MKTILLILASMLFYITAPVLAAGEMKSTLPDLTLEEYYLVRSYFGKNADQIHYSESDRYIAFRWNPYNEFGRDLYLFDRKTNKRIRVTSPERMKEFDPPEDGEKFLEKALKKRRDEKRLQEMWLAQRDYLLGENVDLGRFEKEALKVLREELEKERLEKEKKEDSEKDTNSTEDQGEKKKEKEALELWELRDKLRKKREKERVKDKDLYPGVTCYHWAPKEDELIFEYRGDLFRYRVASNRIHRLTWSDAKESLIDYDLDGDGCFFRSGKALFRMDFTSGFVRQLNHRLDPEKKFKLHRSMVSPDGRWVLVVGSKKPEKAQQRKVKIMSYKKRFAEPIVVDREVPDDKRSEPEYRFYLRRVTTLRHERESEPVFTIPGGDVWYEFSRIEWSRNGEYYAFMTWEREKGDLKIWLGMTRDRNPVRELAHIKETIGYKGSYLNNLKFTPDGSGLVAILNNKDGFRQPELFALPSGEKKKLLSGRFESFPVVGFSRNSRFAYVLSDEESPALRGVYRVDLERGGQTRMGVGGGVHRTATVSHSGNSLASVFGHWGQAPELFVLGPHARKFQVTQSHHPDWPRRNYILPERFTFSNRHGDTIHGMMFKPPGWKATDLRPGIVYLYGGPLGRSHTVQEDNFSTLSYMFQMLMAAKHGYVTINIDPRGQSGYGRGFNEANFDNPGRHQTEDLEDLVAHMRNGFGVDSRRLGLHGWSFGGYQTLHTLFTSPDTFACGIAAAPPTQWENYNSWYTGATISKSERSRPSQRRHSLIPLARNLRRPLLLVHGMLDPNVLYQDTVNVYAALLRAGKETLVDLFLDPEGKHGLNGLVKNKAVYKKFESWFVRHLGAFSPGRGSKP